MKWTFADTVGLALSAAITTVPFVFFLQSVGHFFLGAGIKEMRPITGNQCIIPALIALGAAGLSSAWARWIERYSVEPEFLQFNRVFTYVGLAMVTLIVLLLTFCFWWGPWAIGLASE